MVIAVGIITGQLIVVVAVDALGAAVVGGPVVWESIPVRTVVTWVEAIGGLWGSGSASGKSCCVGARGGWGIIL